MRLASKISLHQFRNTFRYLSKRLHMLLIVSIARLLLFLKLNNHKNENKWIFVLGCYNSGTTILADIISSHKDVCGLKTEGVDLVTELGTPVKYGWPRIWYKCKHKITKDFEMANLNPEYVKWIWQIASHCKKKYFIEKSVINALHIEWIYENFDDPYFIWIVRDIYPVSEGIRRRTKKSKFINENYKIKGYPIETCAKQWVECNKVIGSSLKHKKSIKIKYEDFVNNPKKEIFNIFEFVGLEKIDVLREYTFKFHDSEQGIINHNNQSARLLSKKDKVKIDKILEKYKIT